MDAPQASRKSRLRNFGGNRSKCRAHERDNAPQRPDCVAGHVRFELGNVVANYPFERSHRFPVIQPNSATRSLLRWLRLSTEQARTTAVAMPLLKKASHVVVLTVQGGTVPGPTGEELARYLHRNGVLC